MDPFIVGLIGIIGAIAGYIARVVEQWLRAGWEADEARRVREEARQDKLDEIQRSNLLELQERLQEWTRAEAEIHLADRSALTEHGKVLQLPPGLSDNEFERGRRLMFLTERVRDDDLRENLKALRSQAARDATLRNRQGEDLTVERLDYEFAELMNEGIAVTQHVGLVLRRYL